MRRMLVYGGTLFASLACVSAIDAASHSSRYNDWIVPIALVGFGAAGAAFARQATGWPARKHGDLRLPIRGAHGGEWSLKLNEFGEQTVDIAQYLQTNHGIDQRATLGGFLRVQLPTVLAESMDHDEATTLARALRSFGASVSVHSHEN